MKPQTLLITLLVCSLQNSAYAQYAVLDSANLAQAKQQVQSWSKQYNQMTDQLTQLKQLYASTTGNRGFGSMVNNPQLQGTVPPDLVQTYAALQKNGAGGLTSDAQMIRDQAKVYNCDNRSGTDLLTCQRILNGLAQQQALLQNALNLTGARADQIRSLQDKVSTTTDAKSIAELQARLQVESLQVNNDANRLQLMRALAEASDRSAEQAIHEKEMRSLSLHSDGSDTFHFVPRSQP